MKVFAGDAQRCRPRRVEFGWVRFVVRFRSSPVRQSEVRSGRSEEGGRVICLHSRFRASARRSSTGCRTLNRTTKGLEGNHGTKERPQKTHVAGCTRVGRSGHRSRHHVWHFGTSLKRHHVQRRTHGLRLVAQRSWLCERMSLPSTKPRQDVVSSEYSFYSSQRWCVCVCVRAASQGAVSVGSEIAAASCGVLLPHSKTRTKLVLITHSAITCSLLLASRAVKGPVLRHEERHPGEVGTV